MKLQVQNRSSTRANVLLVTLLTCLIIGFTLASFLTLVSHQNRSVMRSLAWNSAIPVMEAGVEEALSQLHYTGVTNLAQNGWTYTSSPVGAVYSKVRQLADARYEVWIQPTDPPVIISTAFVPAPLTPSSTVGMILGSLVQLDPDGSRNIVVRRVRVPTRRDGLFSKGMQAKGQIDLNGNNITTDSFDSTKKGLLSDINGNYDPTMNSDNGDVATNLDIIDSIDVGNANIMGEVFTGPKGTVEVGPSGSVGTKAWVTGGNKGIQDGHFKDDMNVEFPDVVVPFAAGYATPGAGTVGGTNYAYVLGDGDHYLSSIRENKNGILVDGDAVLHIPGDLNIGGNSYIYIPEGKSLKVYVGGAAEITGNGVINEAGLAINFQYYGLPTNNKLVLSGNATFAGVIYAPSADFKLVGGGSSDYDFVGASVTGSVTMGGHFHFHFDEALNNLGPAKDYIPTAWHEVKVDLDGMIYDYQLPTEPTYPDGNY